VVTYSSLMPAVPEECKPLLRGTLPKPYHGEELLRIIGAILGN
jgi:hypothetical protein